MEFTNRTQRPGTVNSGADASPNASRSRRSRLRESGLLRIATVTLFASIGVLAVALIWFVVLGKPSSEATHIDSSKHQAVFLNGGQVYFGKVVDLNDQYLRLNDIYYLRVDQQVQPDKTNQANGDISLVKLGCELHGPRDEMVVNREQVVFWENLKTDGQVAKAVAQYKQQNPNGQTCTEQSTTKPSTSKNE